MKTRNEQNLKCLCPLFCIYSQQQLGCKNLTGKFVRQLYLNKAGVGRGIGGKKKVTGKKISSSRKGVTSSMKQVRKTAYSSGVKGTREARISAEGVMKILLPEWQSW